jgi:hypothetical protein
MEIGNPISETIKDHVFKNVWARTAHHTNSIIHKQIHDIAFAKLEDPLIWTRSILWPNLILSTDRRIWN